MKSDVLPSSPDCNNHVTTVITTEGPTPRAVPARGGSRESLPGYPVSRPASNAACAGSASARSWLWLNQAEAQRRPLGLGVGQLPTRLK